MVSNPIIPVILCGGSGTRLWPLSRESYPKQYLQLSSTSSKSLLQATIERIRNINNVNNPILICNEEHRFIVAEQMREIETKPKSIILEPFGKNTAPAITLAAIKALENHEDPILLVLSSDHFIQNEKKFIEVLEKGVPYAKKDKLVTFGVIPTKPETGYGYIKAESPFIDKEISGKKIKKFYEKPDKNTALEFLSDKRFTWNSGIFMFKAKKILDEINKFHPNIFKSCITSLGKSKLDLEFQRIDKYSFENCPNISIDVAVMEESDEGIVLPLNVGWSDVGTWESLWENSKKDCNSNVTYGDIILDETKNSYFRSEDRLIVGIGLDNLVVVETSDAILVSKKKYSMKVKEIVEKLKEKKNTSRESS